MSEPANDDPAICIDCGTQYSAEEIHNGYEQGEIVPHGHAWTRSQLHGQWVFE